MDSRSIRHVLAGGLLTVGLVAGLLAAGPAYAEPPVRDQTAPIAGDLSGDYRTSGDQAMTANTTLTSPPTINTFTCEHAGNGQLVCFLSASNWTSIRWKLNGTLVSAWNNRTSVWGACPSASTTVRVDVSNQHGTTSRTSFVNCSGPPL